MVSSKALIPVPADRARTVTEAVAATGVHRNTWYRWLAAGEIPALRVGRDWRIPAHVVEAVRTGKPLPRVEA